MLGGRKNEGIQEIRESVVRGAASDRARVYDDWPAITAKAVALLTNLCDDRRASDDRARLQSRFLLRAAKSTNKHLGNYDSGIAQLADGAN